MKFAVVGDAMWDIYHVGKITRLNPECPTAPLLHTIHPDVKNDGGAANVARNLKNMGIEVVEIYGMTRPEKHRLYDVDHGVVARYDVNDFSDEIPIEKLSEVNGCDAVIVSDYVKGSVSSEIAKRITALNLPTFVDTKRDPYMWEEATALTPNMEEYRKFVRNYKAMNLVAVTWGANGAQWLRRGVWKGQVPARCGAVKNVSGAGDTFVAAFAASLLALGNQSEADEVKNALLIAMDFCAAAVSTWFTCAPTFEEVKSQKFANIELIERFQAAL